MAQDFASINHIIKEPQGPSHSGIDPENVYAPRAPSGPVVVEISNYSNGDRGNWNYRMSFQLPGEREEPPPSTQIEEDEEGLEDDNFPPGNFSYNLK